MNAPAKIQTWPAALAAYLAAKSAEDAYDRDTYMPAFHRYNAAVEQHGRSNVPEADHIPEDIEKEIERLQSIRHVAEDALMAIPSPDAAGFAHKVLVARGEGRGVDGWDDLLEAEARRFADIASSPVAIVTAAMSPGFGDLVARYRDEMAALDAAEEQDDIDRLADQSFDTLEQISATPVRGMWELADKLQIVVDRFADFDPPNMQFVKDALDDARRLSSEPDFAMSWVRLWCACGGSVTGDEAGNRWYGKPERSGKDHERWSTMTIAPHLTLRSYGEWNGAMKALETLLDLSSSRARDAIFALAPSAKEGVQ